MSGLRVMLEPKRVALVGASEEPGAVGRTILENLLLSRLHETFPVNPNKKTVLGLPCFPDVSVVPRPLDLAVIATPARTVPGIVDACGKAGAAGVIIISAGFKEAGEEGRELETEISRIRRQHGMRLIGPNCVGVIRPAIGLNASFLGTNPEAGSIAFISQSGALGSAILDWAVTSHIGFSLFASLGSMLDVDFGDLIDYLGQDEHTRAILLYMEGIGNARKFMSAARGFARSKPIVVVKPGRFTESARAALSHTGALAGDDAVYDAAYKRVGVVRVQEIADLFNAAEVLDSKRLPRGPRLAIITNAGGPGVMATDALIAGGGKLAALSDETVTQLNAILPPFWSHGNPIDLLGDADNQRYVAALSLCLGESQVDGLIVIYTPQGMTNPTDLARKLLDLVPRVSKPVIAVWMGAQAVREARELFARNDIPAYETPEEAVKAYLHMYQYKRNLDLLYETPEELPVDQAPPINHLKNLIRQALQEKRLVLSEEESKGFLQAYGIPVSSTKLAQDVEAAVSAAGRIGYPVVLKIVSPQITHKSDIGGVAVNLRSEGELRESYQDMLTRVKAAMPGAEINGVTVQGMMEGIDCELILGAKKDKDFGSVILFGMGGVGTELFKDVSIGIPPLNQTLARRLMEETRVYKMLQGFRGKPPADLRRLEQIIVSLSNLIVDFPEIAEMDINPLAVAGANTMALDARIILEPSIPETQAPYAHLVITPYPSRHITQWRMSDGTEVLLRAIRPEDEPLEHEMLSTLSNETLRTRFFSVIKDISHEMLVRFCNIDYDRDMAVVAELKDDGRKRIIGIGRLVTEPDGRSAEYAVLVHDQYQSKGLGYKLVDVLIGIAQEKGLDEIYGEVLTENERMLTVTRKLGFSTRKLPDGITKVTLKLK